MENEAPKKLCAYCGQPFTGNHRRLYCDDTCRLRAAYHRFVKVHPDKKTKPRSLQRWYDKRSNALQRGLEFTLTELDVDRIIGSPCYYCGTKIDKIVIERYDNDRGYTLENCVPACAECNRIKSQIHGSIFERISPYLKNGIQLCVKDDAGNLILVKDGVVYREVGKVYEY